MEKQIVIIGKSVSLNNDGTVIPLVLHKGNNNNTILIC